jgi:hypothetical protein
MICGGSARSLIARSEFGFHSGTVKLISLSDKTMSRGRVDKKTAAAIAAKLRDLQSVQQLVLTMSPDFISARFAHDSTVPQASVCLNDAMAALGEASYATFEAEAHLIWYRQLSKTSPNEPAAVFFGRFYAADVALRLYAAGEHLASAIVDMLEITNSQLAPFRKKRVSLQSTVADFMRKRMQSHLLTKRVIALGTSKEWQKAMDYRSSWVHDQPPTVAGLGHVFERKKRWTRVEQNGSVLYTLGVGGGDPPKYTIDQIIAFVEPALNAFAGTFIAVVDFYQALLAKNGIKMTIS